MTKQAYLQQDGMFMRLTMARANTSEHIKPPTLPAISAPSRFGNHPARTIVLAGSGNSDYHRPGKHPAVRSFVRHGFGSGAADMWATRTRGPGSQRRGRCAFLSVESQRVGRGLW